ncbi:MAG: TIGR04255 family protein, partial [bacterium]
MGKHYKNPPLLEAVCEFKFQPHSSWNPAVPDLIYEKVKTQFPQREAMNGL